MTWKCWMKLIQQCLIFSGNQKQETVSRLKKDNPLLLKSVPSMRGRASAGTRRSGEEEGKDKGRRPPWKLRPSEPIFPGRTRVATRVDINILYDV